MSDVEQVGECVEDGQCGCCCGLLLNTPSPDLRDKGSVDAGGIISHDRAAESIQRLINSHFGNEPRARASIPAQPNYDDDLIASAYVEQQRVASPTAAPPKCFACGDQPGGCARCNPTEVRHYHLPSLGNHNRCALCGDDIIHPLHICDGRIPPTAAPLSVGERPSLDGIFAAAIDDAERDLKRINRRLEQPPVIFKLSHYEDARNVLNWTIGNLKALRERLSASPDDEAMVERTRKAIRSARIIQVDETGELERREDEAMARAVLAAIRKGAP